MECSKVVYWPRHLWASPSVITSGLSVRCVRLSKTALCVVSLGADPPFDFELLPAKCKESCRIVLFDAHVAALGNFEKFHSPKLLLQIGDFFRHNEEQRTMASIASDGMDTKLLEAVGYYSLYLPMTALGNATAAFQNILSEFWILSWLCASGETLEELSPFLAVISWQLNNAIGLPDRIRYFNRLTKTRRLTQQERLEVLQLFNWICYVMLDMVLGRVVLAYVGDITAAHIQVINTSILNFLHQNIKWLMGAPAGFKLNKPLASILGNGIILWLQLWNFIFERLGHATCSINLEGWIMLFWRYMGLTLQLTLVAEFIRISTWHFRCVYIYFAKTNRLQFKLFSSLSKLFLGKKINVLRHRVDTCEYDVGQLLLGTLLFTILSFLVTTNLVFFVFFAGVRGSIELLSLLLWLPVVLLKSLPMASVLYRIWNPNFFIIGMELQTCHDLTDAATIEHVGVGRQCLELEDQQREILRNAFASWETSNKIQSKVVTFQLEPVASSFSALFTSLHAYLQAASARYSLAVIAKACLFGSAEIDRVPLSLLFSYSS